MKLNTMLNAPLFIIGYMGCGKTTFGRALANRLGRQFIDLDFYIEQRFHASVASIFAERGEEGFRRLEWEMLHEVAEFSDVVVACGGGTPCFFDNMDYILSKGKVVWLDTSVERILTRVRKKLEKRPLLAGKNEEELRSFIAGGMEERRIYYSRAHIRTDSYHLENARQIDDTVSRFIDDNPEI